MQTIQRMISNICTSDLLATKAFYTSLFALDTQFESDWFIHLTSKDKKLELGIIDKYHELVPKEYQQQANGFYLSFVVADTDELYEIALQHNYPIVSKPHDTFYGQRRMLLKDPNNCLIDVSSLMKNV